MSSTCHTRWVYIKTNIKKLKSLETKEKQSRMEQNKISESICRVRTKLNQVNVVIYTSSVETWVQLGMILLLAPVSDSSPGGSAGQDWRQARQR